MADNTELIKALREIKYSEEETEDYIKRIDEIDTSFIECSDCPVIPLSKEEIAAKELCRQIEYWFELKPSVDFSMQTIKNGDYYIYVPKDISPKNAKAILEEYLEACELIGETPVSDWYYEYKARKRNKRKWLDNVLTWAAYFFVIGLVILVFATLGSI